MPDPIDQLLAERDRGRALVAELQRMAADSYAKARVYRDLFVKAHEKHRSAHQCDADLAAEARVDAQTYLTSAQIAQLVAAALSKQVRVALWIEPPEGT